MQRRRRGRRGHKMSDRPVDFQVRVHVLEARRLAGSGLNPVVKIACGKEMQQTSTQRGTNSPYFDEVFFFNFRDRPEQMFDYVTELKVCDAKKIVSDALIGSFKFDLGLVYDEEDHCYIHKWLLLTDPLDLSSEAKGYLKMSIQVLGPGDNPKYSPSPIELPQEDVDIERNLLRPLGARLEPATLTVRIYRGADLPQMDTGYFQKVKSVLHMGTVYKDYVDPYCTVSFAGHEAETQVLGNKKDPEWKKQINLGVRFPSMCERIRFQIKDKDVNADDYIGTFYLHMSEISSLADNGFLPTFGPCFVNCYGSPREFSILPDKYEHLNKGLIEKGVAYRGRVMVEVEMTLGKLPATKSEDVKIADLNKLAPYLSRSSYRLYCAFHSATMVCPYDKPVEFEVSIGNYGNKLDSDSPIQLSTTPSCNPVYDGKKYYYLPWMHQKPVVQVDSQWEDCSYRINSLNLILFTAESFKTRFDSVKKMVQVKSYDLDVVKGYIGEMLDDFITNLSQAMPELPKKGFTRLDRLIRDQRNNEWSRIYEGCNSLRSNLVELNQLDPPDQLDKLDQIMDGIEDYINQIKNMAYEPQNSVPDVIIWMLSGDKRVAVKRIPSHELMYSSKSVTKYHGKYCGKLQTLDLIPPALEKEEEWKEMRARAQVRACLWLGLEEDQEKWKDCCQGGQPTIFAEIYECQNKIGMWVEVGGKTEKKKEDLESPPSGWRWKGDWKVVPENSSTFKPEEGLNEWTEEIFENQNRSLLSDWPDESKSYWTDLHGTEYKEFNRHKIENPPGWIFSNKWKVDVNRAVDGEGWEYTIKDGLNIEYVPYERNIHHSRRRRWTIVRKRDEKYEAPEETAHEDSEDPEYGWEYASLGRQTFHTTKGTFDVVRRRRHVRKLVNERPGARAVFALPGKTEGAKVVKYDDTSSKDGGKKPHVPRMHLEFKESHTYQLRAYLYQARDMYGSDRSGLSDPYAVISLNRYSSRSRVVKADVCPTWDQTIIIGNIKIFGPIQSVEECPPPVVLEFFDEDKVGKDEFLGICSVLPTVCRTQDIRALPPLDWYGITRYNKSAGEVLVAFELLLDEGAQLKLDHLTKASSADYYIVPEGIRPKLKQTRIEVLCWGVRDMKRFQFLPVSSPLVEVECNGVVNKSDYIENVKKNPNFKKRIISLDVPLPTNPLYCPPINLRVFDKRTFGRLPLVGLHVIKSLSEYEVSRETTVQHRAEIKATKDLSSPSDALTSQTPKDTIITFPDSEPKHDHTEQDDGESDSDWWCRYYDSLALKTKKQPPGDDNSDKKGHDCMVIYPGELEKAFNDFTDLVQTFALYRGKGSRDPEEQEGQPVGYFKGALAIYEMDSRGSVYSSAPPPDPVQVTVRVYIIKGIDLHPRDPDGKSDPYIKVSVGKKTINDRDSYIPSNLNPIFGKVFELPATLPFDHTLTVSVMDWDRVTADDLIGETKIDLENRFFSQHRATCGLPRTYSEQGPNRWRDQLLPEVILNEWIKNKNFPEADWSRSTDGSSDKADGKDHEKLSDNQDPDRRVHFNKQQLALNVLHEQNLVPEHIETRNLYTPMHPNTSQGQLHMWVDIFRKDGSIDIPPPVDVSPRKPEKYVLRVVVWNCEILQDVSRVTGEEMNDLYVKGWICGMDDSAQKTDVHYRSVDGEGNFNWRFVFPFEYIKAEKAVVVKKKAHLYSLTEKEGRLLPRLTMQIWDSDPFTPNDFIGGFEFDLSNMVPPMRGTGNSETPSKVTSLFKRKWVKGWWPVYNHNKKFDDPITAKLELEIEIVSEEESQLRPAGKARDDPNMNPKLDPPNRPATSFFWLTSPWKTFRFIIWKNYKWQIIFVILVILIVIMIIVFVYTAPNTIMNWITSRILPG